MAKHLTNFLIYFLQMHQNLSGKKSRSTEKSTRLLAQMPYIFDRFKFTWFFPVVFGCSFLDSVLLNLFLSKAYGFLASNLKVFF